MHPNSQPQHSPQLSTNASQARDLQDSHNHVLQLVQLAERLARSLAEHQVRLVLAESCTGGNVAATLAAIPGISNWLCGSFVIYRNDSKARWLNIPQTLLDDPQIGPVSQQVTQLLARSALAATPEADVSAAITGHIGPGAPEHLDGHVYLSILQRSGLREIDLHMQLQSPAPVDSHDIAARRARLNECTSWVITELLATN